MRWREKLGEAANGRYLAFTLLVVFLSFTNGYRSFRASAKTQTARVPSTPGVRIQTARPGQSPVKTFQITPPILLESSQLPNTGLVEFRLSGKAGQTLLVRLSNPNLFLNALQGEAGDTRLALAGDSKNRIYLLPRTGIYRFLLDVADERSSVQFSFLAGNDPMIDPGIDPRQFSVNFGGFAKGAKVTAIPYNLDDGDDYLNSWPSHLALERDDFEFRVMLVTAYHATFKNDDDRMSQLATALQGEGTHADATKFPYPVYLDGSMNVFGKPAFLRGDHWRGLRWVGGFGQDVSCNPNLGYIFEGISNDDRYFVLMRAKVANPAQRLWARDCASAQETGIEKLARDITTAGPDTFDPALDKLDAVVESLKFNP